MPGSFNHVQVATPFPLLTGDFPHGQPRSFHHWSALSRQLHCGHTLFNISLDLVIRCHRHLRVRVLIRRQVCNRFLEFRLSGQEIFGPDDLLSVSHRDGGWMNILGDGPGFLAFSGHLQPIGQRQTGQISDSRKPAREKMFAASSRRWRKKATFSGASGTCCCFICTRTYRLSLSPVRIMKA